MSKMEFSDEFDFENRITDTSEIPEDTAATENTFGIHRTGKGKGKPQGLYRGGKNQRRNP